METNPLAITDDELATLDDVCTRAPGRLRKRLNEQFANEVYLPAGRATGGDFVVGTFIAADNYAQLLIAAAEYLYLLPLAIRMVRAVDLAIATAVGDGAPPDAVAAIEAARAAVRVAIDGIDGGAGSPT